MLIPKSNYDPETVALMGRVCDEAWQVLTGTTFYPSAEVEREAHTLMALRIMSAVNDGERNPERLKSVALHSDGVALSKMLRGQTVLLVEDEPMILCTVQSLLEDEGAGVLPATSVNEGLALLSEHDVSASILDYKLRGGTADDLCHELTERKIPFVIYSGYPNVDGECNKWGIVAKPADPQLLVSHVLSVLVASALSPYLHPQSAGCHGPTGTSCA
jgi:CheY-like chemotaxis protein